MSRSKLFYKHDRFMDVCFEVVEQRADLYRGYWWNLSQSGDPFPIDKGSQEIIITKDKLKNWKYQIGHEPERNGTWINLAGM